MTQFRTKEGPITKLWRMAAESGESCIHEAQEIGHVDSLDADCFNTAMDRARAAVKVGEEAEDEVGIEDKRWVTALALELPEAVYKDVRQRIDALYAAHDELAECHALECEGRNKAEAELAEANRLQGDNR